MSNILGIDIGTTSVCTLLTDAINGKTIKSVTLQNDSFIKSDKSFEKAQSPEKIIDTVKSALSQLDISDICAIGVTGQMHGILYLDKNNKPVSPLFIWQDERGNEIFENGKTYAEYLTELTGIKAASGFGLTTHFYNIKNGLVPENAVKISTIHDYLVSVLTNTTPVTHISDAASLGFFDLKNLRFDENALNKAGIDKSFLPEVLKNTCVAGKTNCDFLPEDIPVAVAIGDNQASFLGSTSEADSSVLVNVGTGSQVSFVTNSLTAPKCGEIRPLTDGDCIFVGASLCGGRAYQILKNFFSQCADMLGGDKNDLYKKMDALSENIDTLGNPLKVNCEFCGTRDNPSKRGSVLDLGAENFTPAHLICGVLTGVTTELFEMYKEALPLLKNTPKTLVGSGNGIRKSEVWQKLFEKTFSLPLSLPTHSEEAATGACVFASAASGIFKNIKDAQKSLLSQV